MDQNKKTQNGKQSKNCFWKGGNTEKKEEEEEEEEEERGGQ